MIPGDKSAIAPGGIRIGTPALTSRGFKEENMKVIAKLLHEIVAVCVQVQKDVGTKLVDFTAALPNYPKLVELKKEVLALSAQFGMPGY